MNASTDPTLYIGIGGHVVAIDPSTGQELWRTPLKRSSFVTIHHSGPHVYAGAGGELFCVDAATGKLLWHNELVGLGLGLLAFSGGDYAQARAQMEEQRAASA